MVGSQKNRVVDMEMTEGLITSRRTPLTRRSWKLIKTHLKANQKKIAVIVAVVVIIIIVLLIVLLRRKKQCNTDACKKVSETILALSNFKENPCEDFHRYACGKFTEALPPPEGVFSWTTRYYVTKSVNKRMSELITGRKHEDTEAIKKAYDYYHLCIKEPNPDYSPFLKVLDEMGGWPMMFETGEWDEPKWNLQKATEVAMKYQSFPFVNFKIEPKHDIVLSKPVLTLAFIESQNSHKAYRETILTTLQKITKENLGMGAGKNKTKGNDRKRKGKKDKKEEGGQKPDGDKKDDENTNGTTLEEFTSATPLPILLTSGSTGMPEKNTNVYRKLKQKAIDKLQERVDDLKKQIDYLHKLELQLYKASRKPSTLNNITTLKNVIDLFKPRLDLQVLLSSYLEGDVDEDTKVILEDPSYFEHMSGVFLNFNDGILANYVAWTLVRSFIKDISPPFDNADAVLQRIDNEEMDEEGIYDEEFYRTDPPKSTGVSSVFGGYFNFETVETTESLCLSEIMNKLPYALASSYAKSYINEEDIKNTENICKKIIDLAKVEQPYFFDEKAKKTGSDLMKEVICAIAYPPFVVKDANLNNYYKEFTLGSNYVESNLALRSFLASKMVSDYKARNLEHWENYKVEANATFTYSTNQVTLMPGLYHRPLVYSEAPAEVNWGTIGFIVGHELTHGFLRPGALRNKDGSVRKRWSDKTSKAFESVKNCFVESFNNLHLFERSINGWVTADENMADTGGLWLAFQALLEENGGKESGWSELESLTSLDLGEAKLNRAQLFFVSFAQQRCSVFDKLSSQKLFTEEHTFSNIRMEGTLRNSKEFIRAFKCPEKSIYNTHSNCSIFEA